MSSSSGRGLQRSEHRLLLLGGDAAATVVALLTSLWIWSLTTGFPFDAAFLRKWAVFFVLVPIWVLLVAPSRRLRVGLSLERTWRMLLLAAVTVGVAYLATYFYASRRALPRLPMLYFIWETLLLTLAWRLCYLYALSRGTLSRRALVVGEHSTTAALNSLLGERAPDVKVVATIEPGDAGALDKDVAERGVSEIFLAHKAPLPSAMLQALVRWQEHGIDVVPMSAEYEHLLMRVPVAGLQPDWMFTSLPEWVHARDASRAVKRTLDIVMSLFSLAGLAVISPFIALAIVLDSKGQVLFRQQRLGAAGRIFDVVKFRTMVQGAETEGPQWARKGDPRVTRVGRWLRRTRLDELPQVFNVLRGDMSLVGPRPERPEFAELLERQIPFYRTRLLMRPGVTGWAQVNAEYGDSVEDAALKLEYDLYYIKHRSLMFDLWILVRTVGTVIRMGGR